MTAAELTWTIRATRKPRVVRPCPRCDVKREFVSTDKFRVNGHQSRIDVWLIFQCVTCKFTWKLTIHTRILPSELEKDLFEKFTQNDRATAELYAADEALLRKNGVNVEIPTEYSVEGPPIDRSLDFVRLILRVPAPISARVEAILAKRLGVSRKQLDRLIDAGAVRPASGGKFPKKLFDGLVLDVDLGSIVVDSVVVDQELDPTPEVGG